ncbi:hypothetical protein NDU88_007188 [Pleurodeles waltl]|uniref:Uncharacterized protein n=1 Tax=Pleurodeles waltl TaxID=8319 RepID=A0AAV7NV91_PLEWA|nr:hypothetical protein NDU88_007188 [Pleurodeles waltl]
MFAGAAPGALRPGWASPEWRSLCSGVSRVPYACIHPAIYGTLSLPSLTRGVLGSQSVFWGAPAPTNKYFCRRLAIWQRLRGVQAGSVFRRTEAPLQCL